MPRNYDKTKETESEKITVYGFPSNLEVHGGWKKSLPNILTCNISKTIGICSKHWSLDCLKIKVRGGLLVPAVPPTVFGETKNALFAQSFVSPFPGKLRIEM